MDITPKVKLIQKVVDGKLMKLVNLDTLPMDQRVAFSDWARGKWYTRINNTYYLKYADYNKWYEGVTKSGKKYWWL